MKYLWLLLFNAIYLIPFTVFYALKANYEFLVYIAVIVVIGIVIFSTLKHTKLDKFALWLLSIWSFLHMAGGGIRINGSSLYSQRLWDLFDGGGQFYILKMDQLIHFYGFLVAAVVVYQIIAPYLKNVESRAVFIAWIGSMGLGALNEVIEFVAFISLEQTGVGDLYNTGLDLIFNMFGALVGAFIGRWNYKKKN